MVTTVFRVKFIQGKQDGISPIQPDADFDEDAGYYVDFNLLVEDGTTWLCLDATNGAAVWAIDQTDNDKIIAEIRKLTDILPSYLNQYFADVRYRMYVPTPEFSDAGAFNKVGANFDDSFFVNDTLWIEGSRRNDGPYDIALVTADQILVDPLFDYTYFDTNTVLLYAAVYPVALQDIAARMAWYDVYVRPSQTPGMSSESIGTYSYSKYDLVGGIEYPAEVTAGLAVYKRPRVM